MVTSVPELHAERLPYTYSRLGNPRDVATATLPGTVLMGGGADVDEAFRWLCARGGQGDVLVLRAAGTEAYNGYLRRICPEANSAATLVLPTRAAADHPGAAALVRKADAVWIAGGDQSDYIRHWTGTRAHAALRERVAAGIPVGGTSAGANVLTPFIYSATGGEGVSSSQALADPFHRLVTLDRDFLTLPFLDGVIAEPHFSERDRMGRTLAFMGRIAANGWSGSPRAVAIDPMTALAVDEHGQAVVMGPGSVYFLRGPGPPQVCRPATPLTYRDVDVCRIGPGGAFDLRSWSCRRGETYQVSAVEGRLRSSRSTGAVY